MKRVPPAFLSIAYDRNLWGAVVFGAVALIVCGIFVLLAYESYALATGNVPAITLLVRGDARREPIVWAAATFIVGASLGLLVGHFFWGD